MKQELTKYSLPNGWASPDSIIPLSLDRIIDISEMPDKKFIVNSQYEFAEYFEDIIGIRKDSDEKLIKIKLKFSPLMSEYVSTKPLHGS